MIDSTLIIRKINLISQDFKEIVELSRKNLQEFLASRWTRCWQSDTSNG